MSSVTHERIQYFDAVKGILLLFIILGHSEAFGSAKFQAFFYTFHVPAFMLVSGYFFSATKPLKLRMKQLLIPYAKCAGLYVVLSMAYAAIVYGSVSEIGAKFILTMKASIYGAGWPHEFLGIGMPVIHAIWFLLALAWATAIVWVMVRLRLKAWQGMLVSVALFFIGWKTSDLLFMPLSLQPGLVSVIYVYLGYLMKGFTPWAMWRWVAVSVVAWVVMLVYTLSTDDFLFYVNAHFPNGVIDLVGSIGASIVVIAIVKWADSRGWKMGWLAELGTLTIVILLFHSIDLLMFSTQVRSIVDRTFDIEFVAAIALLSWRLAWIASCMFLWRRSRLLRRLIG